MSDLPLWVTIPSTLLLLLSGTMTLIGSAGLLRFRRFYSRMHAVTLGNTMGACSVVLTSVLVASTLAQRPVLHELLIIMFLVIVSPITGILLMQAGLRRDARRPVSHD